MFLYPVRDFIYCLLGSYIYYIYYTSTPLYFLFFYVLFKVLLQIFWQTILYKQGSGIIFVAMKSKKNANELLMIKKKKRENEK